MGFDIFVCNEVQVLQDVIGYLLIIDVFVIDMVIVYKVLVQLFNIKNIFKLKSSVFVFD